MADQLIYVPLSRLRVSDKNVRKQGSLGIEQLAAQILAEGLLQNLVVVPASQGDSYEIVDGKRRFLALQHLATSGLIETDRAIPVNVVEREHATSASLTAAFGQLPLHAVDRFEAFKALVDEGTTVSEIASSFGIDEKAVHQSLRLASVAPVIGQAFRDGQISLEMLQTFTLTQDQTRQLAVFKNLPRYGDDSYRVQQVKAQLVDKAISGSDPRARLIGISAYEAAGGATRRDLFSGDVFFEDAALVQRIVDARTFELEARVKAEGWSWVEVRTGAYYGGYEERRPKMSPTTPAQDTELASLKIRRDAIGKELAALHRSEPDDDSSPEYVAWEGTRDALEDEHAALTERERGIQSERASWSAKTKAEAGAIITLSNSGRLDVRRGLVDPQTAKRLAKAKEKAAAKPAAGGTEATAPADISDALHQRLAAHRSSVIRRELQRDRKAMLAVLALSLVGQTMGHTGWYGRILELTAHSTDIKHGAVGVDLTEFRPHEAMSDMRDVVYADIPGSEAQALAWLLVQTEGVLLDVIGSCVATAFTGIFAKGQSSGRQALVEQLVEHLNIDMADHWKADRDTYLSAVPKSLMVEAVTEARGAVEAKAVAALAKKEAAEAAELQLADTRWLPAMLRRKGAAKPTGKPAAPAVNDKPVQHISQEEAVAHIQALLEAKRQQGKAPSSWPTEPEAGPAPIAKPARKKRAKA
jgi:ParB family chromosome partitioning protein